MDKFNIPITMRHFYSITSLSFMKEDATGNLFSIYVQVKLSIEYITLLVFIRLFLLIRPVRKGFERRIVVQRQLQTVNFSQYSNFISMTEKYESIIEIC